MVNIRLLALDQIAWTHVAEAPSVFAIEQGFTLGVEPDLLRSVGKQTVHCSSELAQRRFTFPPFEGRGHATAMAAALMELTEGVTAIRKVRAHTLPEPNASTRVLQKLGFNRISDAVDPEVGRVWRWERDCRLPSACP
jgi:GNAT acetyltransferase-like protein